MERIKWLYLVQKSKSRKTVFTWLFEVGLHLVHERSPLLSGYLGRVFNGGKNPDGMGGRPEAFGVLEVF